jgi:putative ABC transport system substrate-binding protein
MRPPYGRAQVARIFGIVRILSIGVCLALLMSACALMQDSAQKRMPHIGVLVGGPQGSDLADLCVDNLGAGLQDLGYVDGQTISIDWRFPTDSSGAQFTALAEGLAAEQVHLIAACNTPASVAVQQATTTIPIIAIAVGDPVHSRLVQSMGHPGDNVTAISNDVPGINAKYVEFLREVVPGLARAAVVVDTTNPANVADGDAFSAAAEATGMHVETVGLRSADDLPAAFETPAMTGPGSLRPCESRRCS